jgi:hypothetical protein
MPQYPSVIDLSTLDGTTGFRLDGSSFTKSGYSVASAGDFNGDGFADVIIGARGANSSAGESYVVFGKAAGFAAAINLSSLDGSNGFRLDGIDASDRSGWSVASAGDVNGDGFADLIVGANGGDPGGDSNAGESYVVFGKASGFAASLDLSTLDGTTGFRLDGIDAGDNIGRSVALAGDINGDGFDDLLVGSLFANPGGDSRAGESYVVFGKVSGFAASLDLSTLDGTSGFRLDGIDAFDYSGYSVASAGDVNGDGFADIIIGAPRADPGGDSMAGESYVLFGKATGWSASLDLSTLDGNAGFRLDGIDASDQSGFSVASAGDVNDDGFSDVIIGAPLADSNGGESYVIFGGKPGEAVTRAGTAIDNTINGGDFSDTLSGLGGNDTLFGHGGNDALDGGAGIDTMAGGAGDDAYTADSSFDAIVETADQGTDTVTTSAPSFYLPVNVENLVNSFGGTFLGYGNAGANAFTGHAGIDVFVALDGNDSAVLGGANDYFYAGTGDTGFGGIGIDVLIGEAGTDTLNGGADQDYLFGGADGDTLNGDAGVDVLLGEAGDDVMNGGPELDYFYGGIGNDTGNGGDGADILVMEAGNDTANGEAGDDYVYAGADNDSIAGGSGVDVLLGEAGNDVIDGGADVDYVFLGTGDDTFVMDALTPGLNTDVLHDFTPGAGSADVLRLLNTGWTTIAQVNAAMTNTGNGYSILQLDPDTQVWIIGILPGQLVAGDVVFS